MSIQSAVTVDVSYAKETTWGEAATGQYRRIDRSGGLLSLAKDTYSSDNIRSDRNVVYSRHGVRRSEGTINGDMGIAAHDDLLETLLYNSWEAGLEATASTEVISADSTFVCEPGTFTGFKVGDLIEVDGFSQSANNGRFRVKGVSQDASEISVTSTSGSDVALADTVDEVVDFAVLGRKLKNGKKRQSLTFRQHFPDFEEDAFQVATGCFIDSASIELQPTGLVTYSYTVRGKDLTVEDSDPASTVVDAHQGSLLSAVDGRCYYNNESVAFVTSLSLNIANNLSGDPVVGSNFVPRLFEGRFQVSGSMTVYLEDQSFIRAFDQEQEISLDVLLNGEDGLSFLRVFAPRVKINGASVTADADGGATATADFECLMSHEELATLILQTSTTA